MQPVIAQSRLHSQLGPVKAQRRKRPAVRASIARRLISPATTVSQFPPPNLNHISLQTFISILLDLYSVSVGLFCVARTRVKLLWDRVLLSVYEAPT